MEEFGDRCIKTLEGKVVWNESFMMQKRKVGNIKEKKPDDGKFVTTSCCMTYVCSQRQWVSAGSGQAVCVEVKGQPRVKGTPEEERGEGEERNETD